MPTYTFRQLAAENTTRARRDEKANIQEYHRGVLGDGLGNIKVSGKEGYLLVRLPELKNIVVKCYNGRGVAEVEGAPVVVGYTPEQPNLLQIINYDAGAAVSEQTDVGKVSPTSTTHINVNIRQLDPLRVSKSTVGNFILRIERGTIPTDNGWFLVTETTLDLTSVQNGIATGYGLYVLVYVDRDGALQYKASNPQITELLTYRSIPYPPPFGGYALAGIRLHNGQTAIQESATITDIVDLRLFQPNYYNIVMQLLAVLQNETDITLSTHIVKG